MLFFVFASTVARIVWAVMRRKEAISIRVCRLAATYRTFTAEEADYAVELPLSASTVKEAWTAVTHTTCERQLIIIVVFIGTCIVQIDSVWWTRVACLIPARCSIIVTAQTYTTT